MQPPSNRELFYRQVTVKKTNPIASLVQELRKGYTNQSRLQRNFKSKFKFPRLEITTEKRWHTQYVVSPEPIPLQHKVAFAKKSRRMEKAPNKH